MEPGKCIEPMEGAEPGSWTELTEKGFGGWTKPVKMKMAKKLGETSGDKGARKLGGAREDQGDMRLGGLGKTKEPKNLGGTRGDEGAVMNETPQCKESG